MKNNEENELEKQVFILKQGHEKIRNELAAIRRIREKNLNLSAIEDIALRRLETNLRHDYVRSLAVAREFEEEFNVQNLVVDLEKIDFQQDVAEGNELTEFEKRLLENAILKYEQEERYESELQEARHQNNEQFLNDIGLTSEEKKR